MTILDTDTCIEILHGNKTVLLRRERHPDAVGICFMTVGELVYGAEKSTNPGGNLVLVEQFLLSVPVIQTDMSILRRFGRLKAELEKREQPLADADLLIAAAVLENGGLLIAGNIRHFERIPGLAIDSWF
jgi:tRNA(fMet)-specific endonuclease VapC